MAIRNRGPQWRRMAEEAKAIAANTHDDNAKGAMLEIAERYEALADYTDGEAEKDIDC